MDGAVGGMIGRSNRRTGGNLAPVALGRPQFPHDLFWSRARDTAVAYENYIAHCPLH
jgi:hypothetical protein